MRYALGSIHIRTLAAIRFRSGILNSCKLGVARTAQEQVLQETLASEAERELVGDDVDDQAIWADLCRCGFGGYRGGDKRCQAYGEGLYDLLVLANGGVAKMQIAWGISHWHASLIDCKLITEIKVGVGEIGRFFGLNLNRFDGVAIVVIYRYSLQSKNQPIRNKGPSVTPTTLCSPTRNSATSKSSAHPLPVNQQPKIDSSRSGTARPEHQDKSQVILAGDHKQY